MSFEITSAGNPKLKRLARLADRRNRDEEGVFVVEGARLVARALEAGLAPLEAYSDGSVEVPGLEVTLVEPEALDRVSYRMRSEGIIAVFAQQSPGLDDLDPGSPALLIVVENLEKPGNLGAILRTADAVGADGVVAVPPGIDRFNPNVLRSSTGASFTMPVVESELGALTSWLHGMGIAMVAAAPEGGVTPWRADLTIPIALFVGSEVEGLTDRALQMADLVVTIPMAGRVDSLNASVAVAVLAYEALRQRS